MEKTCGNCGHGCHKSSVYCAVTGGDMLVDCVACEDWIESKKQHIRCDNIAQLEQRYQQLEEVARNLFKRTLVAYGGEDVSIVEIDDYRKQLEELGVEV